MKTNSRLLTRLAVISLALSTARCGVVAEDRRSKGREVADDEGAEGFNIVNGSLVPSNADGFGMIGSPGAAGCTAIEIAPRCLLTSAHCAPYFDKSYTPDPDPNSPGTNPRYVRVLKSLTHSQYSESGTSRRGAANDLALLWTRDWLPSDGRTWNPRRIATTQISSGLGNIFGYSTNGSSLATEAKKRQGAVRIYSRAADAGGGGIYTIYPKTSGTRICAYEGDSGGPLLNGSVLGVASRGSDSTACTSSDFTYYTDVAAPANKKFIGQAASFCQPDPFSLVVAAKTIFGNSTRSVGNKVVVTLRRTTGTSTVEVVDRPNSDIYERGLRTASLVAVPMSGSSFSKWRPLFESSNCPCAVGTRATSPRCDVGPTDVDVTCVADFNSANVGVASGSNTYVPSPTAPPTSSSTGASSVLPAASLPASTTTTTTTTTNTTNTTTTTGSSPTFVLPK